MYATSSPCMSALQLLTVASTAQRDAIMAEAQGIVSEAWIGLESLNRQPTQTKANFRWLSTGRTPQDWWSAGEPNNAGASAEGVCAVQSDRTTCNGKLYASICKYAVVLQARLVAFA